MGKQCDDDFLWAVYIHEGVGVGVGVGWGSSGGGGGQSDLDSGLGLERERARIPDRAVRLTPRGWQGKVGEGAHSTSF